MQSISKSSNTYAVLNYFINTYFYSFTSMNFPQYIVETSENFLPFVLKGPKFIWEHVVTLVDLNKVHFILN